MWMAMGVGNKFGIEGAAMVMGQANKVLDWGKKAALWAPNKAWGGVKAGAAGTGSFAWRKANAKMSKKYGWSPTALKEAWKKSREHSKGQDMQDIEQATADRTDTFNAASSRIANTVNPFSKHRGKWGIGKNTDHTDEGFAHFQGQVNKNAKHVSEVSSDTRQLLEHLGHAIETEDAADTVAHLRAVAKNNDFNDLVDTMGKDMVEKNFDFKIVGDSYTKDVVDADGKTIQMKFVNKEGEVNGTKLKLTYAVTDDGTEHLQTDSESVKATIAGALKTANVNEDLQNKTMLDLGTIAMSNTHYGYGGMATRNDDGKYVITTAAEQAEYNAGKLETEGGQKISTSIHEGTLYSHVSIGQGKNAKQFLTGLNGEVAKAVISALPDDFQATRARTRVKSYTLATQNLEEVRTAMGKKGNEGYAKAVADIRAAQKKAKDEAEKLSTTSAAANDA
jgi:hypothetical protein